MPQPIIYTEDSGLGQGISTAGSAIYQAIAQRQQRSQKLEDQKKYGSILSEITSELPADASNIQLVGAFNKALAQGVPTEMMEGLSTLAKTLRTPGQKVGLGVENKQELMGLFGRFGMEPEQAQRESDLYFSLSEGGKTKYADFFFDRMQRGQLGGGDQPVMKEESEVGVAVEEGPGGEVSDVSAEEVQQYDFPKIDMFKGLTSKEKVSRQKELFNSNAKDYAEINKKQRGYEDELRRLGQMTRLNDSGVLPKGLERLNINWTTGDIRVPALASPETQQFVKMINDFTTKAKETYGSRVTNFELGAFMKRLPTLANSEEGRRLILEQMKSTAGIERLYQDSLAEVYDKYGLRGVDNQQADKISKELRKDDEKVLLKQYNDTLDAQKTFEARAIAPEGKVPARGPDGQVKYIWTHQADKAEKRGYKIL